MLLLFDISRSLTLPDAGPAESIGLSLFSSVHFWTTYSFLFFTYCFGLPIQAKQYFGPSQYTEQSTMPESNLQSEEIILLTKLNTQYITLEEDSCRTLQLVK